MIAQNLTGSILTTLAPTGPVVLSVAGDAFQRDSRLGCWYVTARCPANTGAWGHRRCAAAMVAMAQDYGAG